MTRDFLKSLGIEDASIDKILDENMKDIGKEKRNTDAAETKLNTANDALKAAEDKLTATQKDLDTLKKANGDTAALQNQLTELQAKYDKDIAERDAQLADRDYSDAVSKAIQEKALKFSSKSAEKAFVAALKEKKLELKEGKFEGLDDFIKAQKEADPDAFAPDKPTPKFVGPTGNGPAPTGEPKTAAEQAAQAIGKASAESGKTANSIISMYTGGKT